MFRSGALVALFVALLALPSCSRPTSPNIVLIVIDTLRADRLGVYGNTKGMTPFIDGMAAGGTVFANTYAPSSWTCPSVASLLTSRYPSQHRVASFESVLSDDEVSVAEALGKLSYDAAGFSANFRLLPELGYAQGFSRWRAVYRRGKIRGDLLRADTAEWLRRERPSPALLYLQFMEPHSPYEPPEPYRQRFQLFDDRVAADAANDKMSRSERVRMPDVRLLASLYNGEVAAVDAQLQELFRLLEQEGVLSNAIIVITADHGEEFREHGLMGHGLSLFNETVRVPLIVVAPGYPGGRVVNENVSLLDIAPTLLDLVGLPAEPRFEGRSLVPLLKGPTRPEQLATAEVSAAAAPDVVLELLPVSDRFDYRRHSEGLVRRSTKLLLDPAGKATAYDLAADPIERIPNPPGLNGNKETLLEALVQARSARGKTARAAAERKPLDEASKEKLRALGYALP